jgi:hypothetical protein
MPYYMGGDYYQGDYYQAGGFLGSIGKALGGAVRGLVTGGPIGAITGAASALIKRPSVTPIPATGMALVGGGGQPMIAPVPGVVGFAQRVIPGGASGFEYRRRRRMNPLNIKALRRALRRAKGFERQAKRVGSFFQPGKTYRLKGRRRRAK